MNNTPNNETVVKTLEFRLLRADEIDVRVQSVKEKGAILLLYKDARVDMNILDETVGALNWQRSHAVVNDNLFATISIYNSTTGQWISKQDVGVESKTEKEKGEASDSFKRAGFNWGIGRELYTSPFIFVSGTKDSFKYAEFRVKEITYNDKREIKDLVIVDKNNKVVFTTKATKTTKEPINKEPTNDKTNKLEMIKKLYPIEAIPTILGYYKVDNLRDLAVETLDIIIANAKRKQKLDDVK